MMHELFIKLKPPSYISKQKLQLIPTLSRISSPRFFFSDPLPLVSKHEINDGEAVEQLKQFILILLGLIFF